MRQYVILQEGTVCDMPSPESLTMLFVRHKASRLDRSDRVGTATAIQPT